MMQTATATGTFLAVPEAMFQLGMIEVAAGNPEASLELIGDHVEGLKSAGIPVWAAQLALASAAALIALKRFDEAKALLDDARSMSASLANALIDGLNLYLRGRLALARDDAASTNHVTVMQRRHRRGCREGGLPVTLPFIANHMSVDLGADANLMSDINQASISKVHDDDTLGPARMQRLKHPKRVRRASRTGVVTKIREHDRRFGDILPDAHCSLDRFLD